MPTPAKSVELHRLTGTKSEASHAPSEADALTPGRPRFPKGISGESKKAFKRLVKMLEERRHLTSGDEEILRLFSILFDRHARALQKIADEGEVRVYWRLDNHGEKVPSEKPNLWLKIAETCEARMLTCLMQLGLTPNARKAVKPTAKPKDSAAAAPDPAEELFHRRTSATAATSEELLDSIDLEEVVN